MSCSCCSSSSGVVQTAREQLSAAAAAVGAAQCGQLLGAVRFAASCGPQPMAWPGLKLGMSMFPLALFCSIADYERLFKEQGLTGERY